MAENSPDKDQRHFSSQLGAPGGRVRGIVGRVQNGVLPSSHMMPQPSPRPVTEKSPPDQNVAPPPPEKE